MDKREDVEEGVKVSDRRRFDASGETRPEAEARADEPAAQFKEEPHEGPEEDARKSSPAQMDFAAFILSLAASAQVNLGAIPDPQSGEQGRDLSLAKQTIDLIGMIEEKTRGNLTSEEASLVEHVLYDLRMMYVEFDKRQK